MEEKGFCLLVKGMSEAISEIADGTVKELRTTLTEMWEWG